VDEPVFANIEISRAGAATPLVGPSLRDVVLERIDAREAALLHAFHLVVNGAFLVLERLNLALAVVNDADRGTEPQLHGAFTDRQRILRIAYPTADDRIDIYVEVSVLGQQLQLLVENFQRFFRDVVGRDVVDRNLQPLEPGAIQALDALRH